MTTFQKIRQFVIRYERHLSVAAMIGGFILDNAALRRPDLGPETILLYFYLISAGLLIILIHFIEERQLEGKWAVWLRPWLPLALQFIFGSLFSAFIVFYSRSASLSASWPFMLLLLAVFAGTELFKKYTDRLAFQNALYFFGIFSFSVFSLPLVVGAIGTGVFLLSGAVAALVYAAFFVLLFFLGPARAKEGLRKTLASAIGVFIVLNIFYFAHLLPPLPLSLKDIGVYHSLEKSGGGYIVAGETYSWIDRFFGNQAVHIKKGDPVYVFSSVFTPVAIKTNLVHEWQHWDSTEKKWITTSRIQFPLVGGRDSGYRGFSVIANIAEGDWRVSVETASGELIGRSAFTVTYVADEPPLASAVL